MSALTSADEERWERWFAYLPYPLLGITTVIALATAPYTGSLEPVGRLVAQLVLVGVVAAWMGWWTLVRPARRASSPQMRVYYVGRTLLALALTLLNPLFCIFAWIGYLDADEHFRGRAVWATFGATAIIMALGQSGGLPWENAGHVALFVVLLLVNFGLALTMSRWVLRLTETSEQRASAITELERVNTELELALAENAELHETILDQARGAGVQEERQRLAREIHDGIAQSLAAVLAQLQAAQEEDDPRRRIVRATELARDALTEARRAMLDLSPARLSESGLDDALGLLVTAWDDDHPPHAELVVTGGPRMLHPEVEATVLRITQEALTNVAKHARAQRVGVTLTYDESEVILDVRDDGVGFDPGARAAPASFGLRGMRQRAARLAGALAVETEPGGGTAISLRLPAVERGAA